VNKIKILTVSTSGFEKKEGISTILLDYFQYFDREKFQLDLVVSGNYDSNLISKFENIGVHINFFPSRKKSLFQYISHLTKLMKREKYNAIYVHGSSAIMTIELMIAKLCGCNTRVVHSHNTTCEHKRADAFLRPIFYKSYTHALACGKNAGEWLFPNRPYLIIKNGRNIDEYKYNPDKRAVMRKKLELKDDTLAIGHVGNFNEQKNQIFLVPVLKKILEQKKDIKLYLIGEGPSKNSVLEKVKKEGLEDNVVFTGSIDYVSDMLQAMDVMVLPSLYEGVPLVVVEWQLAGLPCIVSNRVTEECSFTDLVKFLELESNFDEWAQNILKIASKKRIANQAQITMAAQKNGFDLKDNVEKMMGVFENSRRN
jgi:glycosyltransferase involved in cell wall biosynthesis